MRLALLGGMRVKINILFAVFCVFGIQSTAFGSDSRLEVLVANAQTTLEQNHQVMQELVEADETSECLNLKDCRIDVEDEHFEDYFEDDIDMALEGLSL